ncbi:hypothetical protein NDN08_007063 [Rhodosorus marinus]|uniref:Protein kinase domain-containing protein n=1 Tax=Rhodosorus marinus TaxID=101924 RepID=A0AAV8UFJ6_9RHOD|nr:hypothetical protein NDN08_007063 [Rhodosorus marinus]
MASLALKVVGATLLGGAAAGTAQYQLDEGIQRSVEFWRVALPTYLHYRMVEYQVKDRTDIEQTKAYSKLHQRYSPEIEKLVYYLRGFYLKLMQIGSTRDEFVPEEYMKWAKKTQDDVPPELTGPQVRELVETSLGRSFHSVFRSLEDDPIGAASIGQVHRAQLLDGRTVAVKVQYPHIEQKFRADMKTMMRFVKMFQPHQTGFMEEVERQFVTEFDYRGEAQNLNTIRDFVMPKYGSKVVVPEPIMDLCTKHVLVMEYLEGKRLVDSIREQYSKLAARLGKTLEELEEEQKNEVKESTKMSLESSQRYTRMLNMYFAVVDALYNSLAWIMNMTIARLGTRWEYRDPIKLINLAYILKLLLDVHGFQAITCGSFNGDPHPGNIIVCEDGRLGLLDYGQVKHMDLESRISYAKFMDALYRDDRKEIVKLYGNELGFVSKYSDPDVMYRRACFFHDRDSDDVTEGLNIQLFMEEMDRRDPVISMADEFIMVGRVLRP